MRRETDQVAILFLLNFLFVHLSVQIIYSCTVCQISKYFMQECMVYYTHGMIHVVFSMLSMCDISNFCMLKIISPTCVMCHICVWIFILTLCIPFEIIQSDCFCTMKLHPYYIDATFYLIGQLSFVKM